MNAGIEEKYHLDGLEIRRENQLRLVVYPIIYKVLYIQTVVGNGISEPSAVPPWEGPYTCHTQFAFLGFEAVSVWVTHPIVNDDDDDDDDDHFILGPIAGWPPHITWVALGLPQVSPFHHYTHCRQYSVHWSFRCNDPSSVSQSGCCPLEFWKPFFLSKKPGGWFVELGSLCLLLFYCYYLLLNPGGWYVHYWTLQVDWISNHEISCKPHFQGTNSDEVSDATQLVGMTWNKQIAFGATLIAEMFSCAWSRYRLDV